MNIISELGKGLKAGTEDRNGMKATLTIRSTSSGIAIGIKLLAKRNIDGITECIIFRKKATDILKIMKTTKIPMLLNAENTGGTSCGTVFINKDSEASSSWYTVLGNSKENRYVFFGFAHPVKHRTFLRFRQGFFECGCIVQNDLKKGDVFESDALLIRESDSCHKLLESFGDDCSKISPPRMLSQDYIGWNSWDYYFKMFEDKDLDENIGSLKKFGSKSGTKVKMLMLDDGWFTDYGDWRSNGRFPDGLKKTAAKIRKNGFEPGIWIAPFHISYFSRTYQRNNSVVTGYRGGEKVLEEWAFGPVGFLDPSSREGSDCLYNTFRTIRNAGFRCFKVDFINYLISFGKDKAFADDSLGRIEIVRRALSIIRKAIGEKSHLITCGCPPEAAVGIADANRIGGDISTYGSTVRLNAGFLASRYWMNSRLYTSDPDFLIVRSDATASDNHHNPIHFQPETGSRSGSAWKTANESRMWATLAAMSGGLIVLSDHLEKLNKEGMKILEKALKNSSTASATPLDLMENELPSIWLRKGKSPALALLNWDKKEKEISLDTKRFPELAEFIDKKDLWNGIEISKKAGRIFVKVAAEDAAWFISG